jgi:hypothetical protein
MLALIDGDILPYSVGAVCEGFHNKDRVFQRVDEHLEFTLERVGATDKKIFLSEKGNFRLDVATVKQYKGQRHPDKPKWWLPIREYLYETWDAVPVSGCEADDALSIHQRHCNLLAIKSCICSTDKDLRITPGWHYSWPCGDYQPEKPLYLVSRMGELWPKWKDGKRGRTLAKLGGTGLKFFYMQLITGDSCDNIPGCPGRGPAYAYQLLKDCVSEAQMYSRICAAYREKYTNTPGDSDLVSYENWRGEQEYKTIEELIIEQGQLLWMQTYEGELWQPPGLSV